MYAVEVSIPRRAELASIGKALRMALDMAQRSPPESLGAKAAMKRAEEATDALCAIVAGDVLRLVHATAGRVKR
jgi:hypothetical protein